MAQIYISSTYRDLSEHRTAVVRMLRRMGHTVVGMEDYAASDMRPLAKCLRDIRRVDLYVGVFAWRYGYRPDRGNPANRSITELEYRSAVDQKKPCLVFLAGSSSPWPPDEIDALGDDRKQATSIKQLRKHLEKNHLVAYFGSPDSLASEVGAAVSAQLETTDWLEDALMTAARRDTVRDFGSPTDDRMPTQLLGSSLHDDLRLTLLAAINDAEEYEYLVVDLGVGKSWWSTRLYLLAALAGEYTEIQQLVFLTNGTYLGSVSPSELQLIFARAYPSYEVAYRSDQNPTTVDQAIQAFSIGLGEQFDYRTERGIKEWVTGHKLKQLVGTGLQRDVVENPDDPLTALNIHEIIAQNDPFVALVRDGQFADLVDRLTLGSRVAQAALRRRLESEGP